MAAEAVDLSLRHLDVIPVQLALRPLRRGRAGTSGLAASVRIVAGWHEAVGHVYVDDTTVDLVRVVAFVRTDDRYEAVARCEAFLTDLRRHGEFDFASLSDETSR